MSTIDLESILRDTFESGQRIEIGFRNAGVDSDRVFVFD